MLDGGHFLLESAGDEVAALIRDFLARWDYASVADFAGPDGNTWTLREHD